MSQVFSIEGNIGSGKSTLIQTLKDKYNGNQQDIIFMEEPVSQWVNIKDKDGENMIEKFYRDQDKYAFSFQMMAYISRLSMLKECIKQHPNSVIICERSLYTDKNVFAKMLFDEDKIEDVNYQIYSKWFDEFAGDIPNTGLIYVRADPEVSYSRVQKRARKGECIPLEYLENCHKYHEEWMDNENTNKLVLDGNCNKKTQSDYNDWINEIKCFILENRDNKDNNRNNTDFRNKTIDDLSLLGC